MDGETPTMRATSLMRRYRACAQSLLTRRDGSSNQFPLDNPQAFF